MEISQTKKWFVNKIVSIALAIAVLFSISVDNVIAEGYKYVKPATKKAALLEEVAVAKVEFKLIKKEDLIKPFEMPVYTDMSAENFKIWGTKVKGTDKWNDTIEKISKEEGIDPVFVKCIMAIESSGNQKVINRKNKNGTVDYGLMQVNSGWGSRFNYSKILNDPEYAIRSGIQVIKYKITDAEKKGHQATAFEVLWRYNGKSAQGKKYANKVVKLYEDLSEKTMNDSIVLSEVKEIA